MFKQSLNTLTLVFQLSPTGPLLVKSGREARADPTLVDMNFVRTHHPGYEKPTVFIPGSSLKGTMRSYTERILRTVLGEGPDTCCNPFDEQSFCGKRLENDEGPSAKRYRESCPACRIFGNTALAGRLSITDAYPPTELLEETNATEQRDGVAIDRLLGGVAVGPFTLEVVTRGAFQATLLLENFELWQLGLIGVALRDLGTGLCPIGFGKTRGLGRVKVNLEKLSVGYPGRFSATTDQHAFGNIIYAAGDLRPAWRAATSYHLSEESGISVADLAPTLTEDGSMGRIEFELTGDQAIRRVFSHASKAWKTFALAHREGDVS